MIFLLLKDLLFSEFIDRYCSWCYALCGCPKTLPMLHKSAVIFSGPLGSMSSCMFAFNIQYCLSRCKGAWEMLHFSVSLMNRINNIEYGIVAPCMISLLLKDLLVFIIYYKKRLRVLYNVLESCKHDILELPNPCCKPGWTAKLCHNSSKPIASNGMWRSTVWFRSFSWKCPAGNIMSIVPSWIHTDFLVEFQPEQNIHASLIKRLVQLIQ